MKQRRFETMTEGKSDKTISKSHKNLTQIKEIAKKYRNYSQSLTVYPFKHLRTVPVSPQSLKDEMLNLIENQPQPAFSNLLELTKGWLSQKWKDLRSGISSRLAKLNYLLPSLVGENFSSTQKEILHEWKKNALLHGVQFLWNHVFRHWNFMNLEEIISFYNSMRAIITQMSYLLFEGSLKPLIKQNKEIQNRLYNFTAVEIITSYKEDWVQIAQRVIKPSCAHKEFSFSENYNLKELNARPEILDINSKTPLFQQTAKSLKKLVSSYSKEDVVKNLKEYRANLLKQIETNIQRWRKRKNPKKQVVVQKQDILSCVIYILVRYKIDEIGQTLKYLSFLWGNEMQTVLGSYQVDSYRVDLQVAYEYLSQPVVHIQLPSSKKLENFT